MKLSSQNGAPLNDVLHPNYPENLWWFAAKSDEVGQTPLGLWLLDKPVVFYRKSDGTAVALDNRCPHRWAPLSMGRVEGDAIRCPYHGFQFDADGMCIDIPSQAAIPKNCRVASYPLIERHGTIWIWMGDAALAVETDLPVDTAWLADPEWSVGEGRLIIDANYQLLKENVLDLTHIPIVHSATIILDDWTSPPRMGLEDGAVVYREEFGPGVLPEQVSRILGTPPERRFSRANSGTSINPAVHHSKLTITDPNPTPGERSEYKLSIFHLTTPESPNRFRYQFYMGWNVKLPPEILAWFSSAPAFHEDKTILEAVQAMIARDPRGPNYPEVVVRADHAAVLSRRKLHELLDKERED